MSEIYRLVSDEEIAKVWGNANFGERSNKRDIIAETLLNYAGGFSTGHTAKTICIELGLLAKVKNNNGVKFTSKGKRYLFYAHENKHRLNTDLQKNNTKLLMENRQLRSIYRRNIKLEEQIAHLDKVAKDEVSNPVAHACPALVNIEALKTQLGEIANKKMPYPNTVPIVHWTVYAIAATFDIVEKKQ